MKKRLTESKDDIRKKVWGALEKEGVALFPGAQGRIPNFRGAGEAAGILSQMAEWQKASSIKANPDSPQKAVRALALRSKKTLYMAVPRLREKKCFIRLDPARIPPQKIHEASTIGGAFRYGVPVHPGEIPPLDLIIAGSVAVNRDGIRIGKGGGYSDLEFAIAVEFGFVKENVAIVTTVHPLQVLDQDLPETEHDFRVDFIITPTEIIPTHRKGGRPTGILQDHLTRSKISEIPILREVLPSFIPK